MGFLWALLMPALIVAAGIRQTWRRFQLARRSNVHFLGVKGVDELAAYTQHFDACIMPYRTTPYAECIYPLKLHEYLAAGPPVIGTPIGTLREFTDVVALAASREEWSGRAD